MVTNAPDIVIVGGGNAALCAAITAAENGARVLILEAAPKHYRGGNSRHTRNFRCLHDKPLSVLVDSYGEDEYFDDLIKVTAGNTDETLARLVIRNSEECFAWMQEHGVRFQPSLSGSLSLARTNAFFRGGGKALVNAYYRRAESLGVEVYYESPVTHLQLDGKRITSLSFERRGQKQTMPARAVIVAAGGFQGDTEWLARSWGPAAKNFLIRGTPYNRGVVLQDLLDQGVQSVGDPTQCHAVAIDGRAPKFDGGIVTRLDCVPFSIVVNKYARRFYDEGEDLWPKRYAIWGRLVANEDDQVGYVIIDSKSLDLFMPSVFPPITTDSIEAMAEAMDLPVDALVQTVTEFNAACRPGEFQATELDGLATEALKPPKSNWARPLDTPPYYGYTLRPGVTFTYLGFRVDENAQVQGSDGAIENLWAAGETMAGSILGQGYLAGFGMTIGTVFGRIAGREASRNVG